jgi:hypothetical protein
MKRDQSSLLQGRTEGEVDARKRRRLEKENFEDERAERVERATDARVQAMKHWMKKWDAVHAQSASEYCLVPPVPNPLGATSPAHFSPALTLPFASLHHCVTLLLQALRRIPRTSVDIVRAVNV